MAFGNKVAGRSVVQLVLDDQTQAGMKKWASRAKAFAVVGAAFTVAAASVRSFVAEGDKLDKLSRRVGVGAESLSALGFAARKAGSDISAVGQGFRGMARSMEQLRRGSAEAVDSYSELGLTFDQLQKKTPEQRFLLIADRLSKVTDQTKRSALAMQVLGRSGDALLPLIEGGLQGIQAEMNNARELGATISDEQAKSAARLADAWEDLTSMGKGLLVQLGAELAPAITFAAESLIEMAKVARTFEILNVKRRGPKGGEAFSSFELAGTPELTRAFSGEGTRQRAAQETRAADLRQEQLGLKATGFFLQTPGLAGDAAMGLVGTASDVAAAFQDVAGMAGGVLRKIEMAADVAADTQQQMAALPEGLTKGSAEAARKAEENNRTDQDLQRHQIRQNDRIIRLLQDVGVIKVKGD